MATMHIRKLEALQEKRKTLQKKEDEIKSQILSDLSTYMINANALDVDFDILMGGILDIIEKAKHKDKITEAWKLSGQKFCQQQKKRKTPKNSSASKKVKKGKGHGE